MNKLYKQINKYLLIFGSIIAVFALMLFANLLYNYTPRKTMADVTTLTKPANSGFWSDVDNQDTTLDLSGTKITITTAGQFAYLCATLNNASTGTENPITGKTIEITQSLDFGAYYWTPMGLNTESNAVCAKITASESVVLKNIFIDNTVEGFSTDISDFGLFGAVSFCSVAGQGYLKNIHLENICYNIDVSKVTADTINIGGIAGYFAGQKENSNATTDPAGMLNCGASGKIVITESNTITTTKTVNIGGLVGQVGEFSTNTGTETETNTGATIRNYNGNIRDTVSITVTGATTTQATYNIGGVAGQNAGTITCASIDGTATQIYDATISSNMGNVGGVVGKNLDGATIQNLINGTQNTVKTNIIAQSDANSNLTIGGIVGTNAGTIENCQNYAGVKSYIYCFGGIAGENASTGIISQCANNVNVNFDGDKVQDTTTNIFFGGIVGKNENIIRGCVNKGTIGAENTITQFAGYIYIGGVAGNNGTLRTPITNAIITNCVNYGTIGKNIYAHGAGGIAGNNLGTITAEQTVSSDKPWINVTKFTINKGEVITNHVAGGIAGLLNSLGTIGSLAIDIENCYNAGNVRGCNTDITALGGIVGEGKNCANSTIKNCVNIGEIGSNDINIKEGYVGGIIGSFEDLMTIENCANYAQINGVSSVGGIIGHSKNVTLNYVLATGAMCAKGSGTIVGGIIGKYNSTETLDLTTSVFDLGVLGYGLSSDVTHSRSNLLYQLPAVGGGAFTIENAPLTYYMTAPWVTLHPSSGYYISAFLANSTSWVFPAYNSSAQVYYYPVPKIFNDNSTFATSVSDETSLQVAYPSQQLCLVKLENVLPTEWDSTGNCDKTGEYYINIYPERVLDEVKSYIIAGDGQYVIKGQKIEEPTKISTAIYLKDYTTGDTVNKTAFDNAINDAGWLGQYNFHAGYDGKFYNKSNTTTDETFDFENTTIEEALVEIAIYWTPKDINVNTYEYNYENNTYEQIQQTNKFTYSMNPAQTYTIRLPSKEGWDYYGWKENDSLKYTAYNNDDAWISAWGEIVTEFYATNLEKVKLYCMAVKQRVEIQLNAGSVNEVSGKFADNTTSKNITLVYGETYTVGEAEFLIPATFPIPNYSFRGYYDEGTQKYYRDGDTYCYVTNNARTLTAIWTYNYKTVKYISIKNSDGTNVTLKEIEVEFDTTIPAENQATTENWQNLGITYDQVEEGIDANGYEFAGAFADINYQNAFDFSTQILDDTNIYIKWVAKTFMLTLDANVGKNASGIQREGGWGDNSTQITLEVAYNTDLISYLRTWKSDNSPTSTASVAGFTPKMRGTGYEWALTKIAEGQQYADSALLYGSAYQSMPAQNLTIYLIWERTNCKLTLFANGGNFGADYNNNTTITYDVLYETKLSQKLSEPSIPVPTQEGYIFKWWSKTPDGSAVGDDELMPNNLTLYAVYGTQCKITCYVLGAHPSNIIGEIIVYQGATLGLVSDEIRNNLNEMIKPSEGESAFEFDYWVKMTYDTSYNIIDSTEVVDSSTVINEDINILAKLKPNENYVPPVKDTTNYIIIAGIVIVVALVLLFIVLLARPTRKNFNEITQSRNKDIQAQLDEIRELERRRRNIQDPFGDE